MLEARGHRALEYRVGRSFDMFVTAGGFRFRCRGDVTRVGDVIRFTWEMVSADGSEVAGVGTEIVHLDMDGRIRLDVQFIEAA